MNEFYFDCKLFNQLQGAVLNSDSHGLAVRGGSEPAGQVPGSTGGQQ